MKKTKFYGILTLAAGLLLVSSCDDDILTENPSNFLTPDALLVDTKGAETYLIGAYDAVVGAFIGVQLPLMKLFFHHGQVIENLSISIN